MDIKQSSKLDKIKDKMLMEKEISGAEIIVKTLLKHNVSIIFGYPGGAIMPFYDILPKYRNKMKHILAGHEQGAVHAAEGFARSSNKIGVCIATSGPGATNLITGIADAQMDSVPILCITGQVNTSAIGTEAFQETKITEIVKPITKWTYLIRDTSEIESSIDRAIKIAKGGRPGPVLLDFPKDIQLGFAKFLNAKMEDREEDVLNKKINTQIEKCMGAFSKKRKVLVLFGNGIKISNSKNEFNKFLELTGFYSASTLHGLGLVDTDNQKYLGMAGMHGKIAANKALCEADLIVAIGMRFDDRFTGDLNKFAKQAKIIHVDIDGQQLNKKVQNYISINLDAKIFLKEINARLEKNKAIFTDDWGSHKQTHDSLEQSKIVDRELDEGLGGTNTITMTKATFAINKYMKQNSIVIADVGQHQMNVARYVSIHKNIDTFSSGGLGTMGFSLPAAIGASFANPKKEIYSISGDGGFQMNIQELATVMRYKVDIKIIIYNNSYLGMVRQWQEMFYKNNESFVSLENPDFENIAKAYNIKYVKIDNSENLESVIEQAFSEKGAVLVEIVCVKQEKVMPIIPAGQGIEDMLIE